MTVPQPTIGPGHSVAEPVVEEGVTTPDRPDDRLQRPPRPVICLRHHVWMAACDDCRAAHSVLTRRTPEGTPAAR